jgi:hypothetical protein
MATDLGKVGIVMKGTWSNSTPYEVLDAVYYGDATYIAKQDVPANTLPTNTTYWQQALSIGGGETKNVSPSTAVTATYTVCRSFGKLIIFYTLFTLANGRGIGDNLFTGLPSVNAPGVSSSNTALATNAIDLDTGTSIPIRLTQGGSLKAGAVMAQNLNCACWIVYITT